jgi:outer membrane protein assembly factor BamE (lipoprotein component of BamABCDE complex)
VAVAGRGAWVAGVLALWLLPWLAGCDPQKIAELEEGVATEADVRARFGEPVAVYAEADGARTFEYPRQPMGQRNYMITIAPDGRMSALRQVLTPGNFAKVVPGMDQAQVRRLLGCPARTQTYALQPNQDWDWRFLDGAEAKVFTASFDRDGRVVSTLTAADPERNGTGR